jgi:uncharacterized hydantoinase/oxoprolinase family protein
MEKNSGHMGQKTKTKKTRSPEENMAYLKSLPLWDILENELEELIENQDLELTTIQDLITASLVEVVDKNKSGRERITKNKRIAGSREREYFKLYGNSRFWNIIENELVELIENQDLKITTHPDFAIGSLVKRIEEFWEQTPNNG